MFILTAFQVLYLVVGCLRTIKSYLAQTICVKRGGGGRKLSFNHHIHQCITISNTIIVSDLVRRMTERGAEGGSHGPGKIENKDVSRKLSNKTGQM